MSQDSPNETVQPEKKQRKSSVITAFIVYFFLSQFVIVGLTYVTYNKLSVGLPSLEELEKIREDQNLSTNIYSSDGVLLRSLHREKRFWVNYNEIPQCMIDAVLAAEDSRFFTHWGVSIPDIMRAAYVDIRKMGLEQGASTITQQLARTLFLTTDRTLIRKLKEQIVAVKIENTYSKPEILEFFLNQQFFGNNSYGIQAAAQGYFGKDAYQLTVPEAALIAGILQAHTTFNPRSTTKPREEQLLIAKGRRDIVLDMMANTGKISRKQAHDEKAIPIILSDSAISDYGKAPYFVDHVRNTLENIYEDPSSPDFVDEDFVITSGAKVYTTLDYRIQQIAEEKLTNQLDYIQKLFAGKVQYVRPKEILSDREAVRDSLNKTEVQGALVAIDVKTGKILAMIGGKKYSQQNQFNRATQALRQPGSSFKPFVYTSALDNGWRTCDTIYDGYWSMTLPNGDVWEPRNFSEDHLGLLSLRDGFKLSRNVIAAKLMNDMDNRGIGPRTVKKYARNMGITTFIPEVPSMAIGTAEVKLIEMVSAYTIFPNFGIKTENFAIERVVDKNNTLKDQWIAGEKTEVLKEEVASLMVTMLRSVVKEGTGRIVVGRMGMADRPSAGKTGTGQDFKDTWFIGFTPYIACGVWIGFDSEETQLKEPANTGATATLPVWVDFVKAVSDTLNYPKDEFKLSNNLTTLRLCSESYKLATSNCPESSIYTEYFIPGTEIEEFCDKHGTVQNRANDSRLSPQSQRNRRNP